MIDFLRKLWQFVHPYRGRFFLGLVCGGFFAITNGLLIGSIRVVMQLVFKHKLTLHTDFASAPSIGTPRSIQPYSISGASGGMPSRTTVLGRAAAAAYAHSIWRTKVASSEK